jgi:hypothetical protein
LEYAFNHLSLLNLLSAVAGIDVSRLDPLDCYDIACLPVFEVFFGNEKEREETSESDSKVIFMGHEIVKLL